LRFDTKTNAVTGSTGCNRFAGTYSGDTSHLSFSQHFSLTKRACSGYDEQLVLNALKRVNRYRLTEGELELRENDAIVMLFAKKPD
jgi:heat shock protein HslJ